MKLTIENLKKYKQRKAELLIKKSDIGREIISILQTELDNRESTWDATDPDSTTYNAIIKLKAVLFKMA